MIVVLLSPPGSGKGTQCRRLLGLLGVPHLSTGAMLRESVRTGSEMGKMAGSFIQQGKLVPDDVIVTLVKQRLQERDCEAGCLLDGFPRTVPQAVALDRELKALGRRQVDVALELRVTLEELIRRLVERARQEGRQDDSADTVVRRMEVYDLQTKPVLEYYREQGKLVSIDGMGSADEVFARIETQVRKYGSATGN